MNRPKTTIHASDMPASTTAVHKMSSSSSVSYSSAIPIPDSDASRVREEICKIVGLAVAELENISNCEVVDLYSLIKILEENVPEENRELKDFVEPDITYAARNNRSIENNQKYHKLIEVKNRYIKILDSKIENDEIKLKHVLNIVDFFKGKMTRFIKKNLKDIINEYYNKKLGT